MKKRTSGEELRLAARRALAFGYAALESPTIITVSDAHRLVLRVLAAVDDRLCGGEVGELVVALRNLAALLTGIEERTA